MRQVWRLGLINRVALLAGRAGATTCASAHAFPRPLGDCRRSNRSSRRTRRACISAGRLASQSAFAPKRGCLLWPFILPGFRLLYRAAAPSAWKYRRLIWSGSLLPRRS
ncbi:hypothetical protein Nham_1893 [Nitrobacter hamburgensis X14]|uniref:Uncharacterized protein n=1 Tax=Nitrobacter hamburgensis (strain DSM 10229 / NCIMB 13809 / X14) TaxID=323097 RepID=Q1QM46_NITHX|nr:hypothetical protein Nham_1893 [Nitrobacter hamburgensis X14]